MKRLLTILAFLLLAAPALAFDGAYQDGEPWQLARMSGPMLGSGGSACGLLAPETSGISAQQVTYSSTYEVYIASSFAASSSGIVKTVYIDIKDGGTPPGNLLMWLCGDNSGVPDSTNVTAMDKCTQSTTNVGPPGASYVSTKYEFTGYSINNGTTYWMVLAHSTLTNDTTNYYVVASNIDSSAGKVYDSPDAVTWRSVDKTRQFKMKVTSCDE